MRLRITRCASLDLCVLFICLAATALAQESRVQTRTTVPIDNSKMVRKVGNTHPLARPEYDRGPAPTTLRMERMVLLLQRSPGQESMLLQLLDEQQNPSSPNYREWMAPEEFGRRFGPSDEDIAAVTNWLLSQGFEVGRVAAGRTAIEFSGNAGQIKDALHAEIHRFVVNGEDHWANVSDPQFPAALAPVVGGVLSLHNFRKKPLSSRVGTFQRDPKSGQYTPQFTVSNGVRAWYALGPADFGIIYNARPLWKSSIGGNGQAIAIVGETNIQIQDVRDFRTLFGLPANDPQIILNGPDPGIVPFEDLEADLDIQWSGAVAPYATIKFVTSQSTASTAGVDLSALYIVDNNMAPVVSESYGECEQWLGTAGNQFYSQLWEQAAAQGITVIVSSGDSGSAGCDDPDTELSAQYGLGVNGLASTSFNISMGGTDFNQGANPTAFWNTTNDPTTKASAKSYIPEMAWNDGCGMGGDCSNLTTNGPQNILAGSGGPSTIYAKPSWQTGTGIPQDRMRDTPDLALFASDGANGSFYAICNASEGGNCSAATPEVVGVGGTSAAAPAFAGIMAMVNQYAASKGLNSRQGNANYSLYSLAAQSGGSCSSSSTEAAGCIFNDVFTGSNSVLCNAGSPNCGSTRVLVDSVGQPAWGSGPGYDTATGLGSVNIENLVTAWQNGTFIPTTTTISLSPTTLTHGQPVSVNVTVTSSGRGTPTGYVSLLGNPTGLGNFVLSGGMVNANTVGLVGGSYGVTAHYEGDGTYAASDSNPVTVTVAPEPSKTWVRLDTFDANTGQQTGSYVSTASYGSPYLLRSDVTNGSGSPSSLCYQVNQPTCPSGGITLTGDGAPVDGGSFLLTNLGYVEDANIQLPAGSHTICASYAGDPSFQKSNTTSMITITKAVTQLGAPRVIGANLVTGNAIQITTTISTASSGEAPTGAVTFYADGLALTGTVSLSGTSGGSGAAASTIATISTIFYSYGTKQLTAVYGGDANYAASTSQAVSIQVAPGSTPDFSVSVPNSITVPGPGNSGSGAIGLSSVNGYAGSVVMNCSVQSTVANPPTCTIDSSVQVVQNGSAKATLTIHSISAQGGGVAKRSGVLWASLGMAMTGILFVGVPGLRRRSARYFLLLLIAIALTWGTLGCGGGGNGANTASATGSGNTSASGSAASYLVTVTGSANIDGQQVSHTATLTAIVQ